MMAPSSKFLSEEPPIVVSRRLVKVFGLCEGYLLQHTHHWLQLKAQAPLHQQPLPQKLPSKEKRPRS
jgi:hypothetical protein